MIAEPIRVLFATDQRMVRGGVRALLEGLEPAGQRRISIVAEASDGPETLKLCQTLQPDVVVLELGPAGLQVARALARKSPALPVVVLATHASAENVRAASEAGVRAYVLTRSGVDDLAGILRRVAAGHCGPFPLVETSPLASLTEREREVLVGIVAGESNPQLAAQLGLSLQTVNSHRVNLMEKLGACDVASLTRLALQLGLLPLS